MEESTLVKSIERNSFLMELAKSSSLIRAIMKGSGEMEKCMEKADFNGLMGPVMMEIIFLTRNMGKAALSFLQETIMKDIGKMGIRMVEESYSTTNPNSFKKVSGKMGNFLVIYECG